MVESYEEIQGGCTEWCPVHSAAPLLEPHPADVPAHARRPEVKAVHCSMLYSCISSEPPKTPTKERICGLYSRIRKSSL